MSDNSSPQLCQILREAREAKGMTLGQAEAATRVRQKYLRAMEDGDWTSLPEPLYTKGFIRSYARYLALDGDAMVRLYERAQAAPKTTPGVRPAVRPLRLTANVWTTVIIGLLVFAVFATGLVYLYRQYTAATPPPTPVAIPDVPTPGPTATPTVVPLLEITMPDVVGRELALVETDLRAMGLSLAVGDRRYSTAVAAGRVITQSIPAGIRIRQGQTITVTLSRGRESAAVPNVVNIGFDQAKNILASAGFIVERRDTPSTQSAAGVVIRQEPAPQSAAQPGSTVVVYVSQGSAAPAPGKVTVPNIVGRPWAEAQKTLAAAGLQVRSLNLQDADLVPPGYVLSTSPGAGSQVDPGSGIDVAVRRE